MGVTTIAVPDVEMLVSVSLRKAMSTRAMAEAPEPYPCVLMLVIPRSLTLISAGTPCSTHSEMSTTSRGGLVMVKVVKFGGAVALISTLPSRTCTWVTVLAAFA
jgi:hypothetical protein